MNGERFALYTAGSNAAGQLGIGHREDVHGWTACTVSQANDEREDIFPPSGWQVLQLSSGASHTVAILVGKGNARQIWACGSGEQGQLGPTLENALLTSFTRIDVDVERKFTGRRVERVECGWAWTFLTFRDEKEEQKDDEIIVFGRSNDFGQLGVEHQRGDGVEKIEFRRTLLESSPNETSPLSAARWTIQDICCGLRHTLLLCASDLHVEGEGQRRRMYALMGWGATRHGQVISQIDDKGKAVPIARSPQLIQVWVNDGDRHSAAILSAGKEHSAVYIPTTWTALPGGRFVSTQHERSDGIYLFGSNRQGQLDLLDQTANRLGTEAWCMIGVDCTWNSTLVAYANEGSVYVSGAGSNAKGQLGRMEDDGTTTCSSHVQICFQDHSPSVEREVRLVCGSEYALLFAREANKVRIFGWGWNEHGNLALGDTDDRHAPVPIWPSPLASGPSTYDATHVFAGCGTTFVQVRL